MGKIFYAYEMKQDDPDSGVEAFLNLPATPYEILDAMDRLRRGDSVGGEFRIDE